MPGRINVQTEARAGAVELLSDYAQAASLKLQVYPGRPRSINPPTAFVDVMRERLSATTSNNFERIPVVEIVVLWGTFDSADTTAQRDVFLDGFYAALADAPHGFGANTLMGPVSFDDEPVFVPDWVPPEQQKSYYATRITLEGFANT